MLVDYPTLTHGRHCRCSPCRWQDWTRPELAPCGMHGPSCPAAYQPFPPVVFRTPSRRCPFRHLNGSLVEIAVPSPDRHYVRRIGARVHVYTVRLVGHTGAFVAFPDELHIEPEEAPG
jgi:hypothetical protein